MNTGSCPRHLHRPRSSTNRSGEKHITMLNNCDLQVSGGVTERSRLLAEITDDIETAKTEMEERGSLMTDGSPLVNIRKSLARVKAEITAMDVRIGVVEHTLLQARMKDRSNMQMDLNQAVNDHHIFNDSY